MDNNKNIIKDIIKQTLIEVSLNPLNPYFGDNDPTKIVSDKSGGAGAAQARSEFLIKKSNSLLSKLGIYDIENYMETQGIFSTVRIQTYGKPFGFSFTEKNGGKYSGKAEYNKSLSQQYKTLVLDFTSEEGEMKSILFSTESLKRPYMDKSSMLGNYKGNKNALLGLQIDGIFDVKMKDSGNVPKEEKGLGLKTPEAKNEDKNCGYTVGQEMMMLDGKHKNGVFIVKKITENGLIIQRKGNKGTAGLHPVKWKSCEELNKHVKAGPKNESIYIADDLILEKYDFHNFPEESKGFTKIKILKIGIPRLKEEDRGRSKSKSNNKLSTKNFVKVKGLITFNDPADDSFTNKTLKSKISSGLLNGGYFVRISEKSDSLIFNTKSDGKGDYFVIMKDNISVKEDIRHWDGDVKVNKLALSNTTFQGSDAIIKNLRIG